MIETYLASVGVELDLDGTCTGTEQVDGAKQTPPPLFRVSANRMVFDDAADGKLTGFATPPWHSANKGRTYHREADFFDAHLSAGREFFVLIGDKPGDTDVLEDFPQAPNGDGGGGGGGEVANQRRTVVSVGFFDEARVAYRYSLADYQAAFDLVLPASMGGYEQLAELLLGRAGEPLSAQCLSLVGSGVQRELAGELAGL